MAETPNVGIPLMDDNSVASPISVPLNAMASALDEWAGDMTETASYVGTNAERLAMTAPKLREGITFFATNTGIPWRYRDGNWRRLEEAPLVQHGRRSFDIFSSEPSMVVSWNFPIAFASPPALMVSGYVTTSSNTHVNCLPLNSTTATRADVRVGASKGGTVNCVFAWVAIGERA